LQSALRECKALANGYAYGPSLTQSPTVSKEKSMTVFPAPADSRILADRNDVTFIFKASILDSRGPAFEGI